MLPKRFWREMTSGDFATGEVARWIAVLPTAAIEQHGPHLPLATDAAIAEGMIATVIEQLPAALPVTFLPVQAIGKSNEHLAFPGTLTLSWETATRAWLEIADSIVRAGVRKLVIVNAHGGNVPIIDIIVRELRVRHGIAAVHTAWSRFGSAGAVPAEEERYGIHGGLAETALMLHFRPDLVRMDEAAAFASAQRSHEARFDRLRAHGPHSLGWMAQDLNPNGAVGDAAAASAEIGRRIAAHQAAGFVSLLSDLDRFDPADLQPA